MHELVIYKNNDPVQPLEFRGRSKESCLGQLKKWMNANQGKRPTDPFGVDGLTIFPHRHNDTEIVFCWDECYEEWRLEHGDDPDDFDAWDKGAFDDARDEFLETVSNFGDWDW